MFNWRRGTTRFSMTWSLLGEWNCQISSEFKNLRQSSTRIPSVKLPRTHLLASWHTHSMTGVMTICSRARIKFLKKIGYLSPEFRFTVNPRDGPNRLSGWGVTNGGCNSKSTQAIHFWSNALSLTWCLTDIERETNKPLLMVEFQGVHPRALPTVNPSINPQPYLPERLLKHHKMTMDPCVHLHLFYHHEQALHTTRTLILNI